jgi:arylsulfatase A-like enzyme
MTTASAARNETRWWQRTFVFAIETGAIAGFVEWVLLLARVRGARNEGAILLLFAAIAACIVASLPFAMILAIRPPQRMRTRIALTLFGSAGAFVALAADSEAYVRLYGAQHAMLGLAAVASATAVRSAWPIRTRFIRSTVAIAIGVIAFGSIALRLRDDARAYAAHRGVLLADAMWATHRDVHSLPRFTPPLAPTTQPSPLAQRPRLVLLVTVDALRYDAAENPTFQAFATIRRNAVRFTQAFAPAAWTVPSTYALLTGRGPWDARFTRTMFVGDTPVEYRGRDRNPRRVWPLPLHDDATTLAEALHRAGYRTATCASLPFFVREGGIVRGFDDVDEGVYRQRNRTLRGTTSDLLTACGIAMLDRAAEQPLFLWLHYSDPHEPYLHHPGIPTPGDTAEARYAGEVAFVDEHLRGLLVNVHRRVGLGHTLLVLTADHGEEFGEHGGNYHAVTLYDEIVHVPLFIAAPGVAPESVPSVVSLVDVAPTILDLVGVERPASMRGRSLAGAMRGAAIEPRPAFAESVRYGRGVRAAIEARWTLIYEARARTFELYDRVVDPEEQVIVSDRYPDEVHRLARMMGLE